MKTITLLILATLPASCSSLTPAQKDFLNSRIVAAAASRGVTAADSKAVLNLIETK